MKRDPYPPPGEPPDLLADEIGSTLAEPLADWYAAALRTSPSTALRERLLQRAASAARLAGPMATVRRRDSPVQALAPGIDCRLLYRHGAEALRPGEPLQASILTVAPGAGWLLPGAQAGVQRDWLVLDGSIVLNGLALGCHDYHVQSAAALPVAVNLSSQGGARVYLRESLPASAAADGAAPSAGVTGSDSQAPTRPPFTSRSADAQWDDHGPGIRRRLLWAHDGEAAMLYHTLPGASVPGHLHRRDEECLMLEGELFLDDQLLLAGDYQLAPAGTGHARVSTDFGVVIYSHGDLDLDVQPDPLHVARA